MKVKLLTKMEDGTFKERVVRAELIRSNRKTVWVKLPDGNVIRRHKDKHIVEE